MQKRARKRARSQVVRIESCVRRSSRIRAEGLGDRMTASGRLLPAAARRYWRGRGPRRGRRCECREGVRKIPAGLDQVVGAA